MSTNALARVAYREAGRATVCEVLYGPNVLKHAVIDAEAGEGEVVTFSGMPLPIDCRPPAGRRRGEQVGVVVAPGMCAVRAATVPAALLEFLLYSIV